MTVRIGAYKFGTVAITLRNGNSDGLAGNRIGFVNHDTNVALPGRISKSMLSIRAKTIVREAYIYGK